MLNRFVLTPTALLANRVVRADSNLNEQGGDLPCCRQGAAPHHLAEGNAEAADGARSVAEGLISRDECSWLARTLPEPKP